MSDYLQHNSINCSFYNNSSWLVLSSMEQTINKKISDKGRTLNKWDVKIRRGILTGYNDAFIISTKIKEDILANCHDAEERQRTEELIRPILRGKDIERFGFNWNDLWIIATFPSREYDITLYPSVETFLKKFDISRLEQTGKSYMVNGSIIHARKKTNNKWFETQDSINYWEDFSKPKIIFPNMTKYLPFVMDNKGYYINQKCFFIIGEKLFFLTAFLNSSLFKYCFRDCFPELQGGTRELSKVFFDKIQIINVTDEQEQLFKTLVLDIQSKFSQNKADYIDQLIFDLYGLSIEERNEVKKINKLFTD